MSEIKLEVGKKYHAYVHPMSGKVGYFSKHPHPQYAIIEVERIAKTGLYICKNENSPQGVGCSNKDFIDLIEVTEDNKDKEITYE